jgi:gluconokinase
MTLPLFIIAGPPGSGKTTIAPVLAKKLNYEFFEGAALVSDEDKAIMSKGAPISKAAHLQWMVDIIKTAHDVEKESSPKGIVTTCTALTKEVRALLLSEVKKLNEQGSKMKLIIIWCDINKEDSIRRTENRKDHYYNPVISDWLFARTQVPCFEGSEKEEDTYFVDASQKVEDVIADALKIMNQCISQIH